MRDDTSAISEPAKRPFARIIHRDHGEREPHFSIVFTPFGLRRYGTDGAQATIRECLARGGEVRLSMLPSPLDPESFASRRAPRSLGVRCVGCLSDGWMVLTSQRQEQFRMVREDGPSARCYTPRMQQPSGRRGRGRRHVNRRHDPVGRPDDPLDALLSRDPAEQVVRRPDVQREPRLGETR